MRRALIALAVVFGLLGTAVGAGATGSRPSHAPGDTAPSPPSADPLLEKEAVLHAGGQLGSVRFGTSVAVSDDGKTAIFGAPGDLHGAGSAWVFVRRGSRWVQQGHALAGRGEAGGGKFGTSVALSADGSTALVGAPHDGGYAGAAWVFVRSGSSWRQQGGKLSGPRGVSGLGSSVALSAHGNVALLGAPLARNGAGTAMVFTRSRSHWSRRATLAAPGASEASHFGTSVALSGNGTSALVGGPSAAGGAGRAWPFERSRHGWRHQGPALAASDESGSGLFGASVALSSDGKTALIGGPGDAGGAGGAWVFARTGAPWIQQGRKLSAADEVGSGQLGASVALNWKGAVALVGAPQDSGRGAVFAFGPNIGGWTEFGSKVSASDEAGAGQFGQSVAVSTRAGVALAGAPDDNDSGAAWSLARTRVGWLQDGPKLFAGDERGDTDFGSGVAVSADGSTAIVGGPNDEPDGAAWVFTRVGARWVQQGPKLTPSGARGLGFGSSVALSADGSTAVIGGGGAWVFTRSGSTWSQQGPALNPVDASGFGEFGASVALSGDGNTALVGRTYDNSDQGAAFVFTRAGATWTQQGPKLTGSDESGSAQFGRSVALAADGNTALVGGPFDFNGSGGGAAWAFTRAGAIWSQQGSKLVGTCAQDMPCRPGGAFGMSVALSAHGDSAVIGGGDAAWSFVRSGATWGEDATLTPPGTSTTARFGASVALSSDGDRALVGAPILGTRNAGEALSFDRVAGGWSREPGELTGSGHGFGWFGSSVALTGDGRTALVGDESDRNTVGAAWVFVEPPGTVIRGMRVHRRGATFRFAAVGQASGFECALARPGRDRAEFRACRSPRTYRHLARGGYTYRVRAVEGSAADPTPARRTFRIR